MLSYNVHYFILLYFDVICPALPYLSDPVLRLFTLSNLLTNPHYTTQYHTTPLYLFLHTFLPHPTLHFTTPPFTLSLHHSFHYFSLIYSYPYSYSYSPPDTKLNHSLSPLLALTHSLSHCQAWRHKSLIIRMFHPMLAYQTFESTSLTDVKLAR